MIVKFNLKRFLISLIIPLAVGGISAFLIRDDMKFYNEVRRPIFSPPAAVFPIVWTVLYVLMGISLYLIWNHRDEYTPKGTAYTFFAIQLFLNFIWSPVFFVAREFMAAFIILIFLLIAAIAMAVSFYRVDKHAGILQIPYIIWLIFAAYLNLGIYILN